MTTFDDRKQGFEAKFRHDQDLQFKVTNRRNRLFGLWAAEKMGLAGDAAAAYAREVVAADFERPGDDDVLTKVATDLKGKGVAVADQDLRRQLERLVEDAMRQIADEIA
jgi:hypothetical protein